MLSQTTLGWGLTTQKLTLLQSWKPEPKSKVSTGHAVVRGSWERSFTTLGLGGLQASLAHGHDPKPSASASSGCLEPLFGTPVTEILADLTQRFSSEL